MRENIIVDYTILIFMAVLSFFVIKALRIVDINDD